MREIKFRAWNKKEKCMSTEITLYDFNIDAENNFPENDCELMQYTSLRDKNGVDIYEGDIIKTQVNNGSIEIEEVRWLDYKFYPFGERIPPNYNGTFIEVIGNIYENPELLKEK